PDWAEPVWHLFVVRHAHRDALQSRLKASGIGTLIHYSVPPHQQAAYASLGFAASAFPLASQLASEILSLPMGPHQAAEATTSVIAAVRAAG
ncbi:MAG TPA: DegT/DnrJ/EryC1/StrS family aminotransferase, partial [Nitrococcus sp.]|nr:DegT/DnrJ/EryC1/StrS family aminotransferase [Nitrococcus sp.]